MKYKYRSKELEELDDISKAIYKAYILGRGYKWFGFLNQLEESDNIPDYRKKTFIAMITGRTSKNVVKVKNNHETAMDLAKRLKKELG